MVPTGDFVTLAAAKAYLGITDDSRDSEISAAIGAASQAIANWMGWSPLTSSRSEVRNGNGKIKMALRSPQVTAVSSLTINGTAIPASTGWNVAGHQIDGAQSEFLTLIGGYAFTAGIRNVSIAYTAGWAQELLPKDLVQAALYTIKAMDSASSIDWNVRGESVPGVYSAQYAAEAGAVPQPAAILLTNGGYLRPYFPEN